MLFMQYSIALCSLPEAASDVKSDMTLDAPGIKNSWLFYVKSFLSYSLRSVSFEQRTTGDEANQIKPKRPLRFA